MGRVYRARDTQLVRTVAVKVLPDAFAADPDLLRRFEQEARATAALNHPGIMAIYDVGVHESAPYLVSELLEGTTLRERMSAGRLPFATVLDFAIQVADALAVAHARGIVHRDLKPENLFVCRDDRLKILDFGLAKLTAGPAGDPRRIDVTGTLPNMVLGTPAYMPPEQARGDPADHRSDIFSLGCIVYEMLEGQKPFDGSSAADVISSILKDSAPPLQTSVERALPPALDSIVQRCLAKDPASRFQSAGDLAFALKSVSLHGGQALSPPPGRGGTRGQRSRRVGWTIAAVAGLAAVAALIGLAGMPWRGAVNQPQVVEFLVPPPSDDQLFASMPLPGLLPTAPQVGISPDGSRLAFVTGDSRGAAAAVAAVARLEPGARRRRDRRRELMALLVARQPACRHRSRPHADEGRRRDQLDRNPLRHARRRRRRYRSSLVRGTATASSCSRSAARTRSIARPRSAARRRG